MDIGLEVVKGYGATCLCKMFSEKKDGTLVGLKTLIKNIDNTGAINDYHSGHPQRTNMPFSCRSNLIILLTEGRDMLYIVHFAAVTPWLSILG